MPHTESRYQQDLGFTDGRMFLSIGDLTLLSGTAPLTKNAFGDYSWNLGNSATTIFLCNITSALIRRLGFFEDLQEQFGGGGIAASAQTQAYRPDQIGSMSTAQQLQARTAYKTKGFRLLGLDFVYGPVAGAVLTTNSFGIVMNLQKNNTANSITTVLALAANGLATATQANPYVTNYTLSSTNQQAISNVTGGIQGYMLSADNQLMVEWDMTTASGGTSRVYGIDVIFEYNLN